MMLVGNNEIVREEEIIANIMSNCFTNITTHLKLKPTKIVPKANLESIIDTFQNHETVQRIKLANFHSKSSLKLNSVKELHVKKEILNLSSKKATRKGDNPAQIPKNSINPYLSELTILINNCLKKVFPDDLKLADITPILKREGNLNKDLLVYCLIHKKCLKRFYTNKSIVLWKTSFHFTYAGLEKITMHSTHF